jgi:hypothetical protein
MDIDIEKSYTKNEYIDEYYEQRKRKYLKYYYDDIESGLTKHNYILHKKNKQKDNNNKLSKIFVIVTYSILYTLSATLFSYQIYYYYKNRELINKSPYGNFYGFFLILYPFIFGFSLLMMNIIGHNYLLYYQLNDEKPSNFVKTFYINNNKSTNKLHILRFIIYDIVIINIIISFMIITLSKTSYVYYYLIPLIILISSIPFIFIYIILPILIGLLWFFKSLLLC